MNIFAQFVFFQIGYFLALFSAVYNWSYWTLGYSFLLLLLHFMIESNQRKQELLFLMVVFPVGVLSDLIFDVLGVYTFLTPKNFLGFAPEWLIGLWLIFPPLFGRSLRWMRNRLQIAFLFGFIFSPLSYRFGANIGVVEINGLSGYFTIGLIWGFLMTGFVCFRSWLDRMKIKNHSFQKD